MPTLTPVQEANHRAEQAEKQKQDAERRNIVWSAEDIELTDADADGDTDPEYNGTPPNVPIGIRNEDGEIDPIPESNSMDVDGAQICGSTQIVPLRLDEIVRRLSFFNTITHTVEDGQRLRLLWHTGDTKCPNHSRRTQRSAAIRYPVSR